MKTINWTRAVLVTLVVCTGIWALNHYVFHILVPWAMLLADLAIAMLVGAVTQPWVVSK